MGGQASSRQYNPSASNDREDNRGRDCIDVHWVLVCDPSIDNAGSRVDFLPPRCDTFCPVQANLRPHAQVSVLDSLTMEWHQPKIAGDPMGVRTRHTAVAVHADHDQHDRGQPRGAIILMRIPCLPLV